MESLTFRNQQLTKRISVLQDELNAKNHTKRVRGKSVENNTSTPNNASLLDEMQKKIMDNAQLISAVCLNLKKPPFIIFSTFVCFDENVFIPDGR